VEGSTAAKRLKNTGLGAQSETEIYLASDYLKLIMAMPAELSSYDAN